MGKLILASRSPRRKQLLEALGIDLEVVPGSADESLRPGLPVELALEEVAVRKASGVRQDLGADAWVLAADTAVVLDQRVLGKPRDRAEALGMLRSLAGRTHRVITGVGLLGPDYAKSFSVETSVSFQELREAHLVWYASLDEPYDKAGAYAIQGQGGFLVESIRGSYTNVVGLPMAETVRLLDSVGLTSWTPRSPTHD
ncbi:MAG: septum formation protein Maf [Deltaproteobacteria bacterium]|nr:septum formation protein Maf [Deltaproteobacteria bacterium]